MSDLFSRIYAGAVADFHAAETEAEVLWAKLEGIPGVKPVEEGVKSALKQQLSNGFAFVDTDLKPHFADGVSMVESACDTGLLAFSHGAVTPFVPAVNAGITLFFNQLRAVIDHAEADAKVKFNLPTPTSSAAPTVAGVEGAVGDAAAAALTGA